METNRKISSSILIGYFFCIYDTIMQQTRVKNKCSHLTLSQPFVYFGSQTHTFQILNDTAFLTLTLTLLFCQNCRPYQILLDFSLLHHQSRQVTSHNISCNPSDFSTELCHLPQPTCNSSTHPISQAKLSSCPSI